MTGCAMHAAANIVFWVCAALLFYMYAGYPLHVMLWARLFRRPVVRAPFAGSVTVVIAVFNDAKRLIPKLAALASVRGAERIGEILVGSDGSTDGIAEQVARLGNPRIRVIEFPTRRGKASVLNDLMGEAKGDVVVMTDARQVLAPDALDRLLEPLADAGIGVVSGHLVFRRHADEGAAAKGFGSYWSYEKSIRRSEAAFGSVPGATGALYAIRRALLRPIPVQTILDDVAIPMQAVEQGGRCIFEDSAVCFDEVSTTYEMEQIRKRRTIAGNIQLALLFPRWLLPWRNPIWWQFVSHKLLRLFSPFCLLGLLAASAVLADEVFFRIMLALQLLVYALAWGQRFGVRIGPLAVARAFVALNVTTALAWYDAICGRFAAAWARS